MSSCYDVIIVGAGMAGLRIGLHLVTTHPNIKCVILEKYNYNGGRVVTYHNQKLKGIQWEIGAGRISRSHKRVLQLMKSYGLTYSPLSPTTDWITSNEDKENAFSQLTNVYLAPLMNLPPSVLQTHTLKELLYKTVGRSVADHFMIQFPYHAELHTLRADSALHSFESEMKSNEGFVTCNEGLSEIIHHMADEFTEKGGIILQQVEVKHIESDKNHGIIIHSIEQCSTNKGGKNKRVFSSKACILALHSEAVKHIQGVHHLPILKHLSMRPLVRMYAIFPVHRQKKAWFSDLSNTVTPPPIRYIIPISAEKGIIMISYTDGTDAEYWINHKQSTIQAHVMKEIRQLFPDREIPDPTLFKVHPWNDGCTYWLPGDYDVEKESESSLHPLPDRLPNLFMCGESFAVKQCWMESALEQADKLLDHKTFKEVIQSI